MHAVPRTVLVLDNHDSFTWNLAQYLETLGAAVTVVESDRTSVAAILDLTPGALVLSPGPGRPEDAGICVEAVAALSGRVPILGVCLGHQAIAVAHGAKVGRAPSPMHGKVSSIHHDGRTLFAGLPSPFSATRYHSLAVDPATIPRDLEVSARTEDGVVMGLRHRTLPLEGVQFHPESILTAEGMRLLENFLRGA